VATALGASLFAIYMANGREIGAVDNIAGLFLQVSILRGDGLHLDRFRPLWSPKPLPYFVAERHGALVSRYPIGAPILAVPFTGPQLYVLDRQHPGWERDPGMALYWARKLGKTSAAAMAALNGAILYLLLSALQLGEVALPTALIAALGSNLWMTASQSLWQHGPAALGLTAALALLTPPSRSRTRLLLAGIACAVIVYSRPQDLVAPILIALWVIRRYRAGALWFAILPVILGATLIGYNLWYFGHVTGGYGELIEMSSPDVHGVSAFWTADVLSGGLGTLVSPSRGLFMYSPWIPLSLLALPAVLPRLRRWPLIAMALCTLPLFFLQLAAQATWWAGWSFGPRYWTDVLPLFAIVLGFALDWARRQSRVYLIGLLASGAFAIAIQAIGALCYPSSWSGSPANVDTHHERLWDWRDSELTRCVHDGIRAPE
jgi:hypothetical protein